MKPIAKSIERVIKSFYYISSHTVVPSKCNLVCIMIHKSPTLHLRYIGYANLVGLWLFILNISKLWNQINTFISTIYQGAVLLVNQG